MRCYIPTIALVQTVQLRPEKGLQAARLKPEQQAALAGIDKLDLSRLQVNRGPNDHTGLDFADLSLIGTDGTNGKFER